MKMHKLDMHRRGESGNVLFLILIAVALFAALSYAVTQSSRSGGNDSAGEKSLISSAQLTQYPAGIRTSIVRMLINGVDVNDLVFNQPKDYGSGQLIDDTDSDNDQLVKDSVFHPRGGGATYSAGPADLMADGQQHDWVFSSAYEVLNIGSSLANDPEGNDVIAFLPGVAQGVCRKINSQLGIDSSITGWADGDGDGVPNAGGSLAAPDNATSGVPMTYDGTNPPHIPTGAEKGVIKGVFAGQPYGCFDTDDGDGKSTLVYYHVLVER
jgi:hypothetical protein